MAALLRISILIGLFVPVVTPCAFDFIQAVRFQISRPDSKFRTLHWTLLHPLNSRMLRQFMPKVVLLRMCGRNGGLRTLTGAAILVPMSRLLRGGVRRSRILSRT
jgi:hypothetical protein